MAGGMRDRMWAEALELLDQAERVHRGLFRPGPAGGVGGPAASAGRRPTCWEPPVDVLETEAGELWIQVALPGVPPGLLELRVEGQALVVAGDRPLPLPRGSAGTVHRLETPHGRFERRLGLPPGRYELGRHDLELGCLTITLRKLA